MAQMCIRDSLRGESSRKGADLLDIDQYLNEAHSFGLQSVRAHFNVLAWSDDVQELRHIRNDVGLSLIHISLLFSSVIAHTLASGVFHVTISTPAVSLSSVPRSARQTVL